MKWPIARFVWIQSWSLEDSFFEFVCWIHHLQTLDWRLRDSIRACTLTCLTDQGSPASSQAICPHRPVLNLLTCQMDLQQSPRCLQQVGDRSWPTWHSARFPRISLLAHLLPLEILASRSWPHPILLRRPKSLVPNLPMAALRWWRSSECSFRYGLQQRRRCTRTSNKQTGTCKEAAGNSRGCTACTAWSRHDVN